MPETPEPEALKAVAARAGLELSDERLERLMPQVQRLLEAIQRLHQVEVGDTEPDFLAPREEE